MLREIQLYYIQEIHPRVRHLRGTHRLKSVLKSMAGFEIPKVTKEEEVDIFEQDWDNLIIIDACRQDFWEQETGLKGSRVSKGSATIEYIEKNFSEGDFSDYVYVSANPQFSDWKFEKLTGRAPEDTFHSIFKTFNTDWDEEKNTVLPEDTIQDALTAQKLFPDKKIIVHFLPPHYPFIRKPLTKGGIGPDLPGRSDSAWNLAESGELSQSTVEAAYRDNINYIEDYVRDLAENLKGKTILTSDHGNLVGEAGYGHPRDRMDEPLKKVPYHEL
jgi:hypothetical protein